MDELGEVGLQFHLLSVFIRFNLSKLPYIHPMFTNFLRLMSPNFLALIQCPTFSNLLPSFPTYIFLDSIFPNVIGFIYCQSSFNSLFLRKFQFQIQIPMFYVSQFPLVHTLAHLLKFIHRLFNLSILHSLEFVQSSIE